MRNLHLVILGRQGSGKGTQCLRVADTYGPIHISTGDMLRIAVTEKTELGLEAKSIMDSGQLLPDSIINSIVDQRLEMADVIENGFILDGYPRTTVQAEALEKLLLSRNTKLDLVLNLEVPIDEVTKRMLNRSRADDTEEAINRRLEIYETETSPLLNWFEERDLLTVVDGLSSEDEVFLRLEAVISELISND
tara:strand:- start:471 stop:1049 length:579 start_codon:yes stop_codon:yes gene_type:complete